MSSSRNRAEQFVIPSAANGGLTINSAGLFLFIAQASENLNIDVYDEDNNAVGTIRNFMAGLGQPFASGFTRLVVTTVSGSAGSAALILGTDMATFTMLTGTVNIIDQFSGENQVTEGNAFIAGAVVAAVAAEFSAVVLRNPAGSGKTAYFKNISSSENTASFIGSYGLTALTTETAVDYSGPKLIGSTTNTVMQVKKGYVGSTAPAGFAQLRKLLNTDSPWDMRSREIAVLPGYSLLLIDSVNDDILNCELEWVER